MQFWLPRSTAAASLLVAGTFLVTAPSFAAEPVEDALKAWVAAIDASPGFTATYGTLTVVGGTAVLSGLTVRSENSPMAVEVTADTLTIAGYRPGTPGGFSADDISVGSIRARIGESNSTFTNLHMRSLTVPDYSGVAFDASRPFSSVMQIYKVFLTTSLAEMTIADVTTTQTMGSETSNVTYRNLAMTNFSNGVVAAVTAGPLVMSAPSVEGLLRFNIDKVESYDTNLSTFVHVFDPDEYNGGVGDMQWRPAMRLGAYRNLVVEAPGARVALHDLELTDLRMRQPPASFVAFLDAVMTNPGMPRAEQERLSQQHALNLLASMGLGKLSLRGMDISSNDLDRFHLGEFSMSNLSLDGIDEFAVTDLDLAADDNAIRLQRFAFGDMVFPSLGAIRAAIEAEQNHTPADPLSVIPKLGFIEAMGLSITRSTEGTLLVDRYRMGLKGHVGPIPTVVDFLVQGIDIPASLTGPEPSRMLAELGYSHIRYDYGFNLAWNEADRTVTLKGLNFDIVDVGSLQGEVTFGGLTRDMLEHPENFPNRLNDLVFVGAKFTVTDKSVTNRVIEMQARRANQTPDEFRQQVVQALPFFLMALQNAEFQGRVAPALQAFLTTPGSIVVEAKPASPVPLSVLADTVDHSPQRLPDLLQITVTSAP